MKMDTTFAVADLRDAGRLAKRAEEMGFAGIWSVEAGQTPYLPLAVAAVDTERIEIGTAVAVAFPRSPMVHAMTAWDLQKASRGRMILGLGTQIRKHNERRFSVAFDHPGPRLKDMILAIRHIWGAFDGDHELDYHGEFYTHDYIQPFFNPGPTGYAKPKVFVAAVGEWMCRMAGEVCDGIHVHPLHSVKYVEEVVKPNVEEGLRRAGRDPGTFEYSTTSFAVTGEGGEQEAMDGLARGQIAFYASTPAYRKVLELHGWGDLQPRLAQLIREGRLGEIAKEVTDEMLAEFAVRVPFADLAGALKAKYDGVVDRLSFYLPVVGTGQEDLWEPIVRELSS